MDALRALYTARLAAGGPPMGLVLQASPDAPDDATEESLLALAQGCGYTTHKDSEDSRLKAYTHSHECFARPQAREHGGVTQPVLTKLTSTPAFTGRIR